MRRLWCDRPECWSHPDGREHHVDPCPVADTLSAAQHRFDDELSVALEALVVELQSLWGRLQLLGIRIRGLGHRARRAIGR